MLPLSHWSLEARPGVWAAFATREALDDAIEDKRSLAQPKWLAAAGLHDLRRWTGAMVAQDLGYTSERSARAGVVGARRGAPRMDDVVDGAKRPPSPRRPHAFGQ